MRDIAAIVEPAIDIRQLSRDIAREHIALQDTDRKVEVNAAQGESLRERQTQHRLEMGRLLIEAKKQVPHGGWAEYLRPLGITSQRASEWTSLVKSPTDGDLPKSQKSRRAERAASNPHTRVQGADDETDDQDDEPDETQPDPPKSAPKPKLDLVDQEAEQGREMERVYHTVLQKAKAMEPRVRRQFARELRQTADIVEDMQ